MDQLLISIQRLKDRSYLDNNIDDKTIKNALIDCQEQILEPVLGSKLYNYLIGGVSEGSLGVVYQDLIVNYIWKVLIHGTTYFVARNLLFRLTNSSIVSDSNQNSTAISSQDLNVMRKEQEESYKHHVDRLTRYLRANSTKFPEYFQTDIDGLEAQQSQQSQFYYDGPPIEDL